MAKTKKKATKKVAPETPLAVQITDKLNELYTVMVKDRGQAVRMVIIDYKTQQILTFGH